MGSIQELENTARCVRVTVPPSLEHVAELRGRIAATAVRVGLTPERVYDLKLAVSEACANAIEHATAQGDIDVVTWSLADRLVVEITNPGAFRPGLSKDSEQHRRGLGLPLMASLADQVHVARLSEGATRVSLAFLIHSGEDEATPSALPGPEATVAQLETERLKVQASMLEAESHKEALKASESRVRRKLESILSHEGQIGDLELADILDMEAVQSLVDDLYSLIHIPVSIIDLNGRVLVGAGWQDICTRFHRQHPETLRHCLESDTELSVAVPQGTFKLYKCKNHMWDVVTPIVVGGEHLGNVFSGQFFFEGESIDRELFQAQAGAYGFDKHEYLSALDRVPRLRRESLDAAMALFAKLGQQLSELGHAGIKLARSLAERDVLMASLRASNEDLDRAQEVARTGSWRLDVRKDELQWSKETYRMFGIPPGTPMTFESFLAAVHPDDRGYVEQEWATALDGQPYDIEHRIVVGDEVKWVRERAELEINPRDGLLGGFGTVQDITEVRRTRDQLLRLNRTLQALGRSSQTLVYATDESSYLQEVCRIIVEDCGHAMVWIGYAEQDEGKSVRPVAHSGFEAGYLETLDVTWADTERGRGPTGTAIRTGEPCYCPNMLTDPAFAPWREEAIKRGYASSIVFPLKTNGVAFGAINIYSRESFPFAPDEISLLAQLADNLAFGITALRLRNANARAEREREALRTRQRQLTDDLAEQNEELVRIIQERERAWTLDQALAAIDSAAHSSLAFDEIVQRGLSQAAEALGAESATVSMLQSTGRWQVRHVHALPVDIIGAELNAEEHGHAELAARTGNVVPIENSDLEGHPISEGIRGPKILSMLTVPLVLRSEAAGVMSFDFTSQQRTFSPEDVDFARKAGATMSLALENARLYAMQQQISDTLQQALLSVPERLPGIEFGHLHRSATEHAEVGGDFYDLFLLPGDQVGIVLGDVSGRGVDAVNLAALVKNTIKAYAHRRGTPAQVLLDTNALLVESSGQANFVSAFFGLLDLSSSRLRYSSAGHPPAILRRGGGAKARWLTRTGPVLGVLSGAEFTEATVDIAQGDLLLLYTDGLTEARARGKLYGETRLLASLESLRGIPPRLVPTSLFESALAFAGGALADDLAILALERVPFAAPAPAHGVE